MCPVKLRVRAVYPIIYRVKIAELTVECNKNLKKEPESIFDHAKLKKVNANNKIIISMTLLQTTPFKLPIVCKSNLEKYVHGYTF